MGIPVYARTNSLFTARSKQHQTHISSTLSILYDLSVWNHYNGVEIPSNAVRGLTLPEIDLVKYGMTYQPSPEAKKISASNWTAIVQAFGSATMSTVAEPMLNFASAAVDAGYLKFVSCSGIYADDQHNGSQLPDPTDAFPATFAEMQNDPVKYASWDKRIPLAEYDIWGQAYQLTNLEAHIFIWLLGFHSGPFMVVQVHLRSRTSDPHSWNDSTLEAIFEISAQFGDIPIIICR